MPSLDQLLSMKELEYGLQKPSRYPKGRSLTESVRAELIAIESNSMSVYFPPAADFSLRVQVPAQIDHLPNGIYKDWLPWLQTVSQ